MVTAAGGGLTSADLAALTGQSEYDIGRLLRSVTGRAFASRLGVWRPDTAYVLAHEELRRAIEALGDNDWILTVTVCVPGLRRTEPMHGRQLRRSTCYAVISTCCTLTAKRKGSSIARLTERAMIGCST